MKLKYFSCLAISIALLGSCTKTKTDLASPNNDSASTDLRGTWTWVRTDGGIANNIHDTPASTGKNIQLVLTSDNKYFFYTNGIVSSEGTYSLPTRDCIHDHTNKSVIDFSNNADMDMMVETVTNNLLQTSDDVYDGTESQYSRN